jgi:hypothetical protein
VFALTWNILRANPRGDEDTCVVVHMEKGHSDVFLPQDDENLRNTVFMSTEISLFNNNNSNQFFIIYVPSQQLQGQLQVITLWVSTT